MTFDWSTLALQAANFLILVWLLQHFLYRPVLAVIDQRQQATLRVIADADAAKAAAEATRNELEQARGAIAREREAALQEAYRRAKDEAGKLLDQARQEADRQRAGAAADLAREREEAGEALRERAITLAAEMARRLLAEAADRDLTEVLLERTVARLRELPEHDRAELAHEVADGGTLAVVTAQPLDPAAAERCRQALRAAIGDGTTVTFTDDPALLAGAELHFPHSVLRGSWRASLAAITEDLGRDGRSPGIA